MTDAASELLGPLVAPDAIRAVFTDSARLQGMLDFEAALARAEAAVGVIPAAAASAIAAKCRAELFDAGEIGRAAVNSGNDLIPLVKRLTALVAADDAEAARFVHWGATSQDAMDTGLVLQLRAWLGAVEADLARLSEAAARLADRHRRTPLVGRTWMQHALPTTLGLKAAGWLDAIERHRARLAEIRPRLLALQFGGAAGTLAALDDKGAAVAAALARELRLTLPDLPWHTQRDRLAELAGAVGVLVGTLGKIARDVALMMQTEVGEAFEPAGAGRGGSSTMPHKRNPVAAAVVIAAATRTPGLVATMLAAMVQEHERGLGGWHAEWSTLPELCVLGGGAVHLSVATLAGLEVDARRMRANLDATRGLIMAEAVQMALGARIGRLAAHDLIEAGCKRAVAEQTHLRDVLSADRRVTQHLAAADLDRLFDPTHYLGAAEEFVARALAARRD